MLPKMPGYVVEEAFQDLGEFLLLRGRREADGTAVLLKVPSAAVPSPAAFRRLEHEADLGRRLEAGWALAPHGLVRFPDHLALTLGDPGGRPLSMAAGRFEPGRFFPLAIAMARAVQGMHGAHVVHKDLKPQHFWVDAGGDGVRLTGFGLATLLPKEQPSLESGGVIAGTLAYMSPEQTGRMNRLLDDRTDLYSLGVVFYEMLTERLPCAGDDPLDWMYCHVAITPISPLELDPGLPASLSAIVMKLLSKEPEARYQTASGLQADLLSAFDGWRAGRPQAFSLGSHDVSERLQIPQRLFGREDAKAGLLDAFERVAARGVPVLALVTGHAGVGKTALVNELQRPVLRARGYYLTGKFDRYQGGVPYATISQAFHGLVQQILTESGARILAWKRHFQLALGANAQLIVDVIPQVELVLGVQPPVPDLALTEAQHRFLQVFRQFVGVVAQPEHPVVLVLDDLQWADPASLKLIQHLVGYPDMRHLLVVGTYRDNEVGPAHPLTAAVAAVREQAAVHHVVLAPLAAEHLQQLVAETLRCDPTEAAPLSSLVHQKTGGNPFFAIQFLRMLRQEHLIEFQPEAAAWHWDIDRIRAAGFTENVVDLMLGKLAGFSAETREVMMLAACVGHVVDLATLAALAGRSAEDTEQVLWEAIREELLLRVGDGYRFLHDRVRQAAYSLAPEAERAALHLRIGRMLLARMAPAAIEVEVFNLVGQFNRAAALLVEPAERERIAALNLQAARRAEASAAYEAAAGYDAEGLALLGPSAWTAKYELAVELALGRARCTWLDGHAAEAEGMLADVLTHARGAFDRAKACRLQLQLRETRGDVAGAVEAGLEALAQFGVVLPAHPSEAEVAASLAAMWAALGDRPIPSLIDLPAAPGPETAWVHELLGQVMTPASWLDGNLFLLQATRGVTLSLQEGNAPASALTYSGLALALITIDTRLEDAYRFGKLAYDLTERAGSRAMMARIGLIFGNFVNYWRRHVRTDQPYVEEALAAALETGDLTYASYCLNHIGLIRLVAGENLSVVFDGAERARDFAQKSGLGWMVDIVVAQQRLVRGLQGFTADVATWSDADFDEAAYAARIAGGGVDIVTCWWHIFRLQAYVFAGDFAAARASAERVRPLLWTSKGQLIVTDFHFFDAVSLAAACSDEPGEARDTAEASLAVNEARFRAWARHCPENFAHKADLIAAEAARLRGDPLVAEARYEAAIRGARDQGFVQHEALAYERAMAFYATRGLDTLARAFRREARDAYARWGAAGKVRQLERGEPRWQEREGPSFAATLEASTHALDLLTVLEVSQAISQEIRLPALAETLMRAVLESTGASRGCLLLVRDGELRVVADASAQAGVALYLEAPRAPDALLPVTVVNYVRRTGEQVLLDPQALDGPFADAYLAAHRPRAALGFPILRQSNLVALLYLENDLTAGVFTPERLRVLGLLASQAAISLENAMLYTAEAERARLLVSEQKALAELAAARDLDRLKNQFVSAITHDLRIPLSVIVGYAELLEEGLGGALTPQQLEYLGQIERGAKRLERLVNDLLDFARMEAGTFKLQLEPTEFGATVQEMVDSFKPQADGARVALTAIVPHAPLDVRIDPQRIEQVLGNLIGNALKFTPEGGAIEVRASFDGDELRCEVEDTGEGIEAADLPKLFLRFSQLAAGAQKKRGTGLGLSISKGIVEAHGGRIGVRSEPGKGSVFWFTLPRG